MNFSAKHAPNVLTLIDHFPISFFQFQYDVMELGTSKFTSHSTLSCALDLIIIYPVRLLPDNEWEWSSQPFIDKLALNFPLFFFFRGAIFILHSQDTCQSNFMQFFDRTAFLWNLEDLYFVSYQESWFLLFIFLDR